MVRRKNPPLIVQATEMAALCDVIAGKSSPLQHLIAHGIISNPQDLQSKPENILNVLLSRSLNDVVEEIESAYLTRDSRMVSDEQVTACFKNLRGHIGRQVQEVLADEEVRNADTRLLDYIVGKTTLSHYDVTTADDRGWLAVIEEALLIARAKAGDRSAFNILQPRYKEQVLGPIRPRAHRGDDVKDIEQVAWLLIWEKMPTYDPAYGSFLAFAKNWAGIAARRHYENGTNWLHSLLNKLRRDIEDQPCVLEIDKVHAILTAKPGSARSEQEALPYLEGFEKLSSLTAGKCTLPHQVIAIGFVTLLGMKSQQVIDDLADVSLADSAKRLKERLEKRYVKRAKLTDDLADVSLADSAKRLKERVRRHFQPLHDKLNKPFVELATAKDLKAYPKADFEHLYAGLVGATTLRDYERGPTINTKGSAQSSTPGDVVDKSPTPEAELVMKEKHEERLRNYEKLLRLTFGSCSPPHQLIALGFVKLLEMKPRQVVKELSDTPLGKLATRLEKEYVEWAQLPPERVRPHFQPLYEKLERPFFEIVTEKKTLDAYPQTGFLHLYDRPSGDTTLQDYYTEVVPEANISYWCDSVMRRVWKKWLEEEVQEINPHELIAYGLVRLLGMRPQQVEKQYWDTPLKELAKRLEDEYVKKVGFPQKSVHPHFQPVYDKLRKSFPDIATKSLQTYPKARYPRLYNRPCGETTLSNYCSGEPEDCIRKWCDTVESRIGKWPLEWPLEEED